MITKGSNENEIPTQEYQNILNMEFPCKNWL